MNKLVSFLSGALLMLVVCWFYYENPLLPEPTLMERYDLTEEEAKIIEAMVGQVEADMEERAGKAVDLDISDLYWIEDPKAHAQLVLKLEESFVKLKDSTISSLEENMERVVVAMTANSIKESLITNIQTQYGNNEISIEDRDMLLVLVEELELPGIEEIVENPDTEPTTDEIKMQLIYIIEKKLNNPEEILTEEQRKGLEKVQIAILKVEAPKE